MTLGPEPGCALLCAISIWHVGSAEFSGLWISDNLLQNGTTLVESDKIFSIHGGQLHHVVGGLNNRTAFSHSSRGWKSRIKVSRELIIEYYCPQKGIFSFLAFLWVMMLKMVLRLCCSKTQDSRTSKMTQWEKMLAAELNDLSLIPQAYMVKTENLLLWIILVYNSVSLSLSLSLSKQHPWIGYFDIISVCMFGQG